LARHLTEELTKTALERALHIHCPAIHHSDQGVQYAATGYVRIFEAAQVQITQVQISMAARGKPTENAYAERMMRTLKEEEVSLHEYRDLADASQHIARFLDDVYMHKRVHSALGYLPPGEFEAHWYAQQAAQREPRSGMMTPSPEGKRKERE
jgi:putative transposase